jgi:carbon monoxide dehydrogenase subunit G
MSTSHAVFTEHIDGSSAAIFALIADLPEYGRWLPGSQAFGATTQVTPYPVCLGTTYLDAGPTGERPGSVVEFAPPVCIGFHQTMLLKRPPLTADVDITIRYTLEPEGTGTRVVRTVDLAIAMAGFMKVAEPIVVWAFRKENARVLAELKRYIETHDRASHEQDLEARP